MHLNILTFFDVDRGALDKCDRVVGSWRMVDAGGRICHEYELPATHSESKLFAKDIECGCTSCSRVPRHLLWVVLMPGKRRDGPMIGRSPVT